jgi:phosphoglycolate phosphatase-like HAD superfamily hydrolase
VRKVVPVLIGNLELDGAVPINGSVRREFVDVHAYVLGCRPPVTSGNDLGSSASNEKATKDRAPTSNYNDRMNDPASMAFVLLEAIMRFSGYIFDVEGTLVDSVRQNLLSLQDALVEFDVRASYDLLQLYSGLDGDQTLQLVAPNLDGGDRKKVLGIQSKIYEANYLESVQAFPRVRDVFLAMTRSGGRIALATDCKGPALKHYLSLLNVSDLIDSMACGDDVAHGKPDPRLVGLAVRKLGVATVETVMIGDTPYDAEAARGAGTAAAGLLTGGFAQEVLADAGCFVVAKDLGELLTCLQNGSPPRAVSEGGIIVSGCGTSLFVRSGT